jgi:hypothetical protein
VASAERVGPVEGLGGHALGERQGWGRWGCGRAGGVLAGWLAGCQWLVGLVPGDEPPTSLAPAQRNPSAREAVYCSAIVPFSKAFADLKLLQRTPRLVL